MMHRTQVTLDPELQKRALRKARSEGISFSAYVRRLLARDLEAPGNPAAPSAVFDLGDSRGSDVAVEKDLMVAEAFADRLGRDER